MRRCLFLLLTGLSILVGCTTSLNLENSLRTETPTIDELMPSNTAPVTPSPYPTSTPIPTMLPEEVTQYFRELLLTNNGCHLPCFLGITLGETTWDEVEELFLRGAYKIYPPDSNMDPASAYITVQVDESLYVYQFIEFRFLMQGGVVVEIRGALGLVEQYNLSELLVTLGKPTEIHLGTWVDRSAFPEFRFPIYLYYPEMGFMATYRVTTKILEELVIVCPRDELPPYLMFWESEEQIPFFELSVFDRPGFDENYHPTLLDATGMSIEEFYETFSDPDTEACLEIPMELFSD